MEPEDSSHTFIVWKDSKEYKDITGHHNMVHYIRPHQITDNNQIASELAVDFCLDWQVIAIHWKPVSSGDCLWYSRKASSHNYLSLWMRNLHNATRYTFIQREVTFFNCLKFRNASLVISICFDVQFLQITYFGIEAWDDRYKRGIEVSEGNVFLPDVCNDSPNCTTSQFRRHQL
jgi:hypothetical protein